MAVINSCVERFVSLPSVSIYRPFSAESDKIVFLYLKTDRVPRRLQAVVKVKCCATKYRCVFIRVVSSPDTNVYAQFCVDKIPVLSYFRLILLSSSLLYHPKYMLRFDNIINANFTRPGRIRLVSKFNSK